MRRVRIGSKNVDLGECIGRGGEGEVFVLGNDRRRAVKIYKAELCGKRENKVRAMVAGSLANTTDLVAFPHEIALDQSGRFVGFAMRLVSGHHPIHELYSPKSRRINFPTADYRFLIRTAGNMARAVAKVHHSQCIIGDLNHSGVLVSSEATVALIDADSFQFSASGKLFPCVVGVPDFTPPELHGKNLSNVTRTREHDYFGLAVAIFHFLLMGRHPYAGVYSGADLSLSEAIEQNRFAFSRSRREQTKTTPPPGAMTLDDLHPPIASAFEAAFGPDPSRRPDAAIWVTLIDEFEKSLNRCSAVRVHYYASAAGKCVWCKLSDNSGIDMFPDLSTASSGRASVRYIDISKILTALDSLQLPAIESLLPNVKTGAVKPSKAALKTKIHQFGQKLFGAACLAGAAIGLFNAVDLWIIWIPIAWWGLARLSSEKETGSIRQAFNSADDQAQLALNNFLKNTGIYELYILKQDLDMWASEFKGLRPALQRELAKLSSTRAARQRAAFLDRFLIRNASISGIGLAKTVTLASFGIETAADINQSAVMRVPGFGPVLTSSLVQWRKMHEAKFRYNPASDASDKQAENAIRAKFDATQADLETKITKGYTDLSSGMSRVSATSARAKADPNLIRVFQARAQAGADMESVGLSVPSFVPNPPRTPQQPGAVNTATTPSIPSRTQTTTAATSSATPNCPRCGSRMVSRLARRGRNAGSHFWGCSHYPRCKGTRN